jgi:ribonuclease HI
MSSNYYAVAKGKNPGIYTSWDDAKLQVIKFPGAKYKKFKNKESALEYIKEFNPTVLTYNKNKLNNIELDKNNKPKLDKNNKTVLDNNNKTVLDNNNITKKNNNKKPIELSFTEYKKIKSSGKSISQAQIDANQYYNNINKIVLDIKQNLKDNELIKYQFNNENIKEFEPSSWNRLKRTYYIYTDGSFQSGTKRAGYGIYFGNNTSNLSVRMPDGTTNNYCELLSIYNSLKIIKKYINHFKGPIIIISDSKYSITSLTDWCYNWIKNNWRSSTGKEVKNKELIKKCFLLLCEINEININDYLQDKISKKDILNSGINTKHGKLKVKFQHQHSHIGLKTLLKKYPSIIEDFKNKKIKTNEKFNFWLGNEIADNLALGIL